MKVDILGTKYEFVIKNYTDDEKFERENIDGYCNFYNKEIVVCDMTTRKGWENETKEDCIVSQKWTARHEITHAFLYESGLDCSSNDVTAWARNEEIVDWIALQGVKIYNAWKEADCL